MRFKMKKILYATDFSKNAENAFIFALKLAEKNNAELIMLHVFENRTVWAYPITVDLFEMKTEANNVWKNQLQELFEQYNTDVKATFLTVEHSSIVKGILSVIKDHDPCLIVTGTKGKSKIKELIMGSTTKALIKKSPIPVLAIPEEAVYKGFKDVLYTSDFHEADIQAIEQLIDLVKGFKPNIRIVHVSSHDDAKANEKMKWFEELLNEKIRYKKITCHPLLAYIIFDRLNSYLKQFEFDLLVMLEKERDGILDELFHIDLVKKMEFHAKIPLLSYNEHHLREMTDQDAHLSGGVEQEI